MRGGVALVAAAALVVAGCGSSGSGPADRAEVRLVGSDTMLLLNRRLAAEFMALAPGTVVEVEGGGSGAGIAALIAGTADLAASSRPLGAEEVQALYERVGTLGVTYPVAADALSVYLHPDRAVANLSLSDLAAIFAGEISDWGRVGGAPGAIRVLIRPPASGTHRFFRDHVLRGRPYRADAEMVARTPDIVAIVAADSTAIGYGGLAYGSRLVHCRVEGVAPPVGAAADSAEYPLSRHLMLVAAAPVEGAARAFVDFCVGPRGQAVVRQVGYLPLWLAPGPEAGP